MSRLSSQFIGWALAATGAMLAIAAVASVVLLSRESPATSTAQAQAVHRTPRRVRARAGLTQISARKTSLGTLLVAGNGHTLYAFSRDSMNTDACASLNGCLQLWPMMAAHGKLTAGSGIKQSLLGTILVRGQRQATYAGHPLYTYIGDAAPAETSYVGVSEAGGTWPAVSPGGALIK